MFTLTNHYAMKRLSKVYNLQMGFTALNRTEVKQIDNALELSREGKNLQKVILSDS